MFCSLMQVFLQGFKSSVEMTTERKKSEEVPVIVLDEEVPNSRDCSTAENLEVPGDEIIVLDSPSSYCHPTNDSFARRNISLNEASTTSVPSAGPIAGIMPSNSFRIKKPSALVKPSFSIKIRPATSINKSVVQTPSPVKNGKEVVLTSVQELTSDVGVFWNDPQYQPTNSIEPQALSTMDFERRCRRRSPSKASSISSSRRSSSSSKSCKPYSRSSSRRRSRSKAPLKRRSPSRYMRSRSRAPRQRSRSRGPRQRSRSRVPRRRSRSRVPRRRSRSRVPSKRRRRLRSRSYSGHRRHRSRSFSRPPRYHSRSPSRPRAYYGRPVSKTRRSRSRSSSRPLRRASRSSSRSRRRSSNTSRKARRHRSRSWSPHGSSKQRLRSRSKHLKHSSSRSRSPFRTSKSNVRSQPRFPASPKPSKGLSTIPFVSSTVSTKLTQPLVDEFVKETSLAIPSTQKRDRECYSSFNKGELLKTSPWKKSRSLSEEGEISPWLGKYSLLTSPYTDTSSSIKKKSCEKKRKIDGSEVFSSNATLDSGVRSVEDPYLDGLNTSVCDRQDFRKEEKELMAALEESYALFKMSPELHSKYESSYREFSTIYETLNGVIVNLEVKRKAWEKYWNAQMNEAKDLEWKRIRNDLFLKYKEASKTGFLRPNSPSEISKEESDIRLLYAYNPSATEEHTKFSSTSAWKPRTHCLPVQKFTMTSKNMKSNVMVEDEETRSSHAKSGVEPSTLLPKDSRTSSTAKDKAKNSGSKEGNVYLETRIKPFEESLSTSKEESENEQFSVIGTLSLLEYLTNKSGDIGRAISSISCDVRSKGANTPEGIRILNEEDNVMLIGMVIDKLKVMHELTQDPVYEKALSWTEQMLKVSKAPVDIKNKLNLRAIAEASVGKNIEFVFNLIKTGVAYEGHPPLSQEEINEIYLKICAIHFEIVSQECSSAI